ncbi:MAG: helicase C-terminal domain-containing protein [Myxococcota bacterium]
MAIRFDDGARSIALSVRDLADEGGATGHLVMSLVQSRAARAAAGRQVHLDWQLERAAETDRYRAELVVKRTLAVGDWTATVWGRIDGVERDGDHVVVEEVKSTPLDARRLYATRASDWPAWLAQLEIYLWMLAQETGVDPVGRLVLVSLADGSRHVLGVALDRDRVGERILARLTRLCADRERRIAWMAERRAYTVPTPHAVWRPGQREIAEAVEWGIEAGRTVLVQAPTGLGKTDAALVGALKLALRTDRQVFWATARTTQQDGLLRALGRLAAAGLPLRTVQLTARDKLCLNGVVDCRPDVCRYAESYFDRLDRSGLLRTLADRRAVLTGEALRSLGADHTLCPFELGLDAIEDADLVVGDYNYVFDPSVHLARAFDDAAAGWIVVVDEVHQLVDRARDWLSPALDAAVAREAAHRLWALGAEFAPFVQLAQRVEALIAGIVRRTGPVDAALTELPEDELRAIADAVDAVAVDYAILRADRAPAGDDPWLTLARDVLRFAGSLDADTAADTVTIAGAGQGSASGGRERIERVNLDPRAYIGPRIARLGGFVGLSATLAPIGFHRDLLGLDPERLDWVDVPSPFPADRRRVVIASRVSTAFKDREQHATPTAALLSACVAEVPGNVAIYFPSFAMLDDLVGRMTVPGRELVVQRAGMSDLDRALSLARLGEDGPPKVLCAVLGGVFAEGIDLPPGALSAVFVVSPALPPIGLVRDLLREHFERTYGAGFLYASLAPGMTRVVQAAGRLIRRPEDRGVVMLVDRRFRWRDLAGLLPTDWAPVVAEEPAREIRAFFAALDP